MGKWQAYFRQAGTYDVALTMKVTEPDQGDFTNFKFGVYENVDDENQTDETPMDSEGTVITEDAVKVWMTSTEKSQDMLWYKEPTEMKNQLAEKTLWILQQLIIRK